MQKTYMTLSNQNDLSPDNEIVTKTLMSFVAFLKSVCGEDWASALPDEPELAEAAAHLPRLCGLAEVEMEKWWCRRFLAEAGFSPGSLEAFWYFENYRHLVEAELSLLGAELGSRAVLLGSGALPLTAILLSRCAENLAVHCVDHDGEACGLARRLIHALGITGQIEIVAGKAEDYCFRPDDTVICASLLAAPAIFDTLAERGVRTFISRDVAGVFRFCYRQAKPPLAAYRVAGQTDASIRTINISRLHRLVTGYGGSVMIGLSEVL